MKKAILFLVFSMFAATLTIAQVKKSSIPKTDIKNPGPLFTGVVDSVLIKYVRYTDTVKVRITVYVEDHSLYWMNGYALTKKAKFSESDVKTDGDPVYYDDKFNRMKPTDIFTVFAFNW